MSASETMASIAALLVSNEDSVVADMAGPQDVSGLDYSLESVKQVDALLEQVHLRNRRHKRLLGVFSRAPDGAIDARISEHPSFQSFVMRTGAYVGEAMRRAEPRCEWVQFDDWMRDHPKDRATLGERPDLATVYMLKSGGGVCFPLGKVVKYIANGGEDSVYSFASILVDLERKPS
jgi:hypothetical protein